jgi:hypothetical protein
MIQKLRSIGVQWVLPAVVGVYLLALFAFAPSAGAINQIPTPNPIPGSYGLAATKTQEAPTQAATITTPGNGASYSNSPITVAGVCQDGLLVQLYNNGVMVGSVMCTSGSFSLQVSLFAGTNELTAIMYDDLEQAGPVSNIVTVNYTDTSFTAFGSLITLTSSYGRRSAPANSELTWPLQLTGGTGPYAFSIDWGDSGKPELKSQAVGGVVNISHVYKKAGIYQVNITVTDVNGVTAFLQVIAVASGKVDGAPVATDDTNKNTANTQSAALAWIPAAVAVVMLFPAFYLGRLSQTVSIRNKMLKERDSIKDE